MTVDGVFTAPHIADHKRADAHPVNAYSSISPTKCELLSAKREVPLITCIDRTKGGNTMAAKNKKRSVPINPFESTLLGRTISPAAMERAVAAASNLDKSLKSIGERARLYSEAYKLRLDAQKQLKREATPLADITDLRKVADEVAKRKVVAPKVTRVPGGILTGSYVLRITPPYAYSDTLMYGSDPADTRNSAVANAGDGELGFTMLADLTRGTPFTDPFSRLPGRNIQIAARLGVFFFPLFAQGLLRAEVPPALSYAWWTVSTGMPAWTFGQIALWLMGFRLDGTLDTFIGGSGYQPWDKHTTDLEFDWGSFNSPMTLYANTDGGHFYLIYLECVGMAQSFGRDAQASVAGGMMNCALPYVDIDFQYTPIFNP
jgi:hypothetical protein